MSFTFFLITKSRSTTICTVIWLYVSPRGLSDQTERQQEERGVLPDDMCWSTTERHTFPLRVKSIPELDFYVILPVSLCGALSPSLFQWTVIAFSIWRKHKRISESAASQGPDNKRDKREGQKSFCEVETTSSTVWSIMCGTQREHRAEQEKRRRDRMKEDAFSFLLLPDININVIVNYR